MTNCIRAVTLSAVLSFAAVTLQGCVQPEPTPEEIAELRERGEVTELQALAEQGNAVAHVTVGVRYGTGEWLAQDDAEAVRWYRLAAAQGDAYAQVNLGLMYANGHGVPQDDAEAVRWYRLAAGQGDAYAQVNLGVMYGGGRGVPQDYVQAHMWFNLAASRLTGEARETAVQSRDVAARQLTPDQRAEAQRRVREWDAAHPQ